MLRPKSGTKIGNCPKLLLNLELGHGDPFTRDLTQLSEFRVGAVTEGVGLALFYLGIFSISLLMSFVFTRYVRDTATARRWVFPPLSDRHLHSEPLPRLGGVAIFFAFLFSFTFAVVLKWYWPSLSASLGFSSKSIVTILLPALLVFLLGVYDDLRPVGPYMKFGVQAVAACLLFKGGLEIINLPVFFGPRHFPWFVSLPLTILWVVAITNSFNLIDGLDGLAAGSALFSTMVVFVVALVSHSPLLSLITVALAGALFGFLRYNFNPATIFLGDSGSLFIGFMLSALALDGAQKAPTIIAVAIPLVSFGLPILETALSVMRRFISGKPVFRADREHIHHKLLQLGFSQRQAVITLYAVSALFALLSLFLLWPTESTVGLVLAVLGLGIWLGVQRLNYLEFGELRRLAQRTIEQRQVFVNNLSIRRACEELKNASDYQHLARIIVAAFSTNDFDAIELRLHDSGNLPRHLQGMQFTLPLGDETRFTWRRSGTALGMDLVSSWSLTLDMLSANNCRYGSLVLYRVHTGRDLQIDVNLLVSQFSIALADALERSVVEYPEVKTTSPTETIFATAQVS
jgi:UDP-GlcNAc:undecaprenyl-phosphate GlcNAc-1-phosphate transferase